MTNSKKDMSIKESSIRIYPPEMPTVIIDNGVRRAKLPENVYLALYMQIVNNFESVAVVENEFCKMTAKYENGMIIFSLTCVGLEESIHILSFDKFETYALVVHNKADFIERLNCDYEKYETVNILSVLVPFTRKRVRQITLNNGALCEQVCERRFLSASHKFLHGVIDECKVNKEFNIHFSYTKDPEVIAINYYCISEDRYTSQHFISISYMEAYIETYVLNSAKE